MYQVDTQIDLSTSGSLAKLANVLDALANLQTNPGKAILDIAAAQKVGGIGGIPSFLRSLVGSIYTAGLTDAPPSKLVAPVVGGSK